jgi:hypothetical protein
MHVSGLTDAFFGIASITTKLAVLPHQMPEAGCLPTLPHVESRASQMKRSHDANLGMW